MNTLEKLYDFRGCVSPPAYTTPDGGRWVKRLTGSATVAAGNAGMELSLITTLENEAAWLYMNDVLPFDIDDLKQVDIYAKITSAMHAAVELSFGLCSAYNADPDLMTVLAAFRCWGSTAVLIDTDDGTNDNNDVATGQVISTTFKRFTIDFASGVKTVVPPPSVGGKANVLFNIDDTHANLQAVARSTRFDMSNYSSGLQLFAMLQKGTASSVIATGVTQTLTIERIRVRYQAP